METAWKGEAGLRGGWSRAGEDKVGGPGDPTHSAGATRGWSLILTIMESVEGIGALIPVFGRSLWFLFIERGDGSPRGVWIQTGLVWR